MLLLELAGEAPAAVETVALAVAEVALLAVEEGADHAVVARRALLEQGREGEEEAGGGAAVVRALEAGLDAALGVEVREQDDPLVARAGEGRDDVDVGPGAPRRLVGEAVEGGGHALGLEPRLEPERGALGAGSAGVARRAGGHEGRDVREGVGGVGAGEDDGRRRGGPGGGGGLVAAASQGQPQSQYCQKCNQ